MKVIKISDIKYEVINGDHHYLIGRAKFGGHWVCNCPAFQFRKVDKDCKHILALKVDLDGKKNL